MANSPGSPQSSNLYYQANRSQQKQNPKQSNQNCENSMETHPHSLAFLVEHHLCVFYDLVSHSVFKRIFVQSFIQQAFEHLLCVQTITGTCDVVSISIDQKALVSH